MSKEYFYPELDLVEKNGKRYYLDSNNHPVPSVTTILSLTSNKSGVDEWRRRVGSKKADEIVHEKDYDKVKEVIKRLPKATDLIALPVIEYWGGPEKVRIDVNPWKWRLSRNRKYITHGIPKQLRVIDEDGQLYALSLIHI